MTSRHERMKMQRRMQRRIQLVVEERRIALGAAPRVPADQAFDPARPPLPERAPAPEKERTAFDPERTMEIPAGTALRAIGRVAVEVR